MVCNISRSSKDAVGLREERDCELRNASHSSHAPMSAHINIYFIMKIIRENYKRFPDEPHTGHGRHLSNHYLAKRRSAGDGACLGTLFVDHRAQQSSPSVAHLHSDLHRVMGYEAVGGRALLIILQPFLQSWLWMNRSWRRGTLWFNAEIQKDVAPLVLSPNHFFPKAAKSFKEKTDTVGGWSLTGFWIQILGY